jgi:hypothetical protein
MYKGNNHPKLQNEKSTKTGKKEGKSHLHHPKVKSKIYTHLKY